MSAIVTATTKTTLRRPQYVETYVRTRYKENTVPKNLSDSQKLPYKNLRKMGSGSPSLPPSTSSNPTPSDPDHDLDTAATPISTPTTAALVTCGDPIINATITPTAAPNHVVNNGTTTIDEMEANRRLEADIKSQTSNPLMAMIILVSRLRKQINIDANNSDAGVNNLGLDNNAHVDDEANGYEDGTPYADDKSDNVTTNYDNIYDNTGYDDFDRNPDNDDDGNPYDTGYSDATTDNVDDIGCNNGKPYDDKYNDVSSNTVDNDYPWDEISYDNIDSNYDADPDNDEYDNMRTS
jgi:hypothetical protein